MKENKENIGKDFETENELELERSMEQPSNSIDEYEETPESEGSISADDIQVDLITDEELEQIAAEIEAEMELEAFTKKEKAKKKEKRKKLDQQRQLEDRERQEYERQSEDRVRQEHERQSDERSRQEYDSQYEDINKQEQRQQAERVEADRRREQEISSQEQAKHYEHQQDIDRDLKQQQKTAMEAARDRRDEYYSQPSEHSPQEHQPEDRSRQEYDRQSEDRNRQEYDRQSEDRGRQEYDRQSGDLGADRDRLRQQDSKRQQEQIFQEVQRDFEANRHKQQQEILNASRAKREDYYVGAAAGAAALDRDSTYRYSGGDDSSNSARRTESHSGKSYTEILNESSKSSFTGLGGSSDHAPKYTDSRGKDINLGQRIIAQRELDSNRHSTMSRDRLGKELHIDKKTTSYRDVLASTSNVSKDVMTDTRSIVTGTVRKAAEDDENYVSQGAKQLDHAREISRMIAHPNTYLMARKGIPMNAEELSLLVDSDRFNGMRDLSAQKRLKSIELLDISKQKLSGDIVSLRKMQRGMPNDVKLKGIIAKKEGQLSKVKLKQKDFKLLNTIKGADGKKAANVVARETARLRNMRRMPLTAIKTLIDETGDEFVSTASGGVNMAIPVVKKLTMATRMAGRAVGKVAKVAGSKVVGAAATTAIGQAFAQTKVAKVAATTAQGLGKTYKVVRNPVKTGKKKLSTIKRKKSAERLAKKLAKGPSKRGIRKVGRKLTSRLSERFTSSVSYKAASFLAALFAKATVAVQTFFAAVVAVVGAIVTFFLVIAGGLLMMSLLLTVIMIDDPEVNMINLVEILQEGQQEFEDSVLSMKELEDDRTTVVIHLPEDSTSLDNSREILSMTAVYFQQDFAPPVGGGFFEWLDRKQWVGDGINNQVVNYMKALQGASQTIRTQDVIKQEVRSVNVAKYPASDYEGEAYNNQLPNTMHWTHAGGDGNLFHYQLLTGYKTSWSKIRELEEDEDYEVKAGEKIEKGWIMKSSEEPVYTKKSYTFINAEDNNKASGITTTRYGNVYSYDEDRIVDITYKHIFVDIKRFDTIFDTDNAGNLYYSNRLGLSADKVFTHNIRDFGYINGQGIITVGKYQWQGQQALFTLRSIYNSVDEFDWDALNKEYPEEVKEIKSLLTIWSAKKAENTSDDMKYVIEAILNSNAGTTWQQQYHADYVGDIFDTLRELGITDEKVLLLYGEMAFRKGVDIFKRPPYSTMISKFLDSEESTALVARDIYLDTVGKHATTEDNVTVGRKFSQISALTGLKDNLSGGKWTIPVGAGWRFTSGWTNSRGAIYNSEGKLVSPAGDPHHAVDLAPEIANTMGVPIIAARDGVVAFASVDGTGSNTVTINHADGYKTLYAHLANFSVTKGMQVKAGQEIGIMGETGMADGIHLHFEIHLDGVQINPEIEIPDILKGAGKGSITSSSIGILYNGNPEWGGWDEDNREWAKSLYFQEWDDIYGLYDHGTPNVDIHSTTFQGWINRAYGGQDEEIDDSKIEGIIGKLPDNMSSHSKQLVRNLLNAVDTIDYKDGGLPTGPGISGAEGGLGHDGLVQWAYSNIGVSLPSGYKSLWDASSKVSSEDIKVGDIAYQHNLASEDDLAAGAISIYIGSEKWVEMTPQGVKVKSSPSGVFYRSLSQFRP